MKVLGIDTLEPPHTLGSTHGDTRFTRRAIVGGDFNSPFSMRYDKFCVGSMPIFIWDMDEQSHGIYRCPAVDGKHEGLKIATGQYELATSPQLVRREVDTVEIQRMYEVKVRPYFPVVKSTCNETVAELLFPAISTLDIYAFKLKRLLENVAS